MSRSQEGGTQLKTGSLAKPLTIKQAAVLAGVGTETVRFYERERLIPEAPRSACGYRQYSEETVRRLRFIKRAQALGFSLSEVRELFALTLTTTATRADIRDRAEAKLQDIEDKMQALYQLKTTLTRITQTCDGKGPLRGCPILEALQAEEQEQKESMQ